MFYCTQNSLLNVQGDPKKMSHSVLQLKSVVGVPFYFVRCVTEPDPKTTSHFTDTLSESKMAQQRKTFHFVFCNTSKKIVDSAQQTACSPLGPKQFFVFEGFAILKEYL